jgi:hypothetical protein
MENKGLEQLFKSKLSEMVIEPSIVAKDVFARKIHLAKQRILIRRISIAASIILLALAGVYTFLPNKVEKADLTQDESLIIDQGAGIAENGIDQKPDVSSENMEMLVVGEDTGIDHNEINKSEHLVAISEVSDKEDLNKVEVVGIDEEQAGMENKLDDFQEDKEVETLIADHVDESVYVEYLVEDPEPVNQPDEKQYEPVKITIEYIASGKNKEQSETDRKEFYSKLDNMKSVDEVLGDIRTYKDRLFALDFKKEKKVKEVKDEEK